MIAYSTLFIAWKDYFHLSLHLFYYFGHFDLSDYFNCYHYFLTFNLLLFVKPIIIYQSPLDNDQSPLHHLSIQFFLCFLHVRCLLNNSLFSNLFFLLLFYVFVNYSTKNTIRHSNEFFSKHLQIQSRVIL